MKILKDSTNINLDGLSSILGFLFLLFLISLPLVNSIPFLTNDIEEYSTKVFLKLTLIFEILVLIFGNSYVLYKCRIKNPWFGLFLTMIIIICNGFLLNKLYNPHEYKYNKIVKLSAILKIVLFCLNILLSIYSVIKFAKLAKK